MRRRLGFTLAAIAMVASGCVGRSGGGSQSQPEVTLPPTTAPVTTTTTARPASPPRPAEEPAPAEPAAPERARLGRLVADTGFRPDTNGFGFENYGSVLSDGERPTNLTLDDLRVMFGDGVCLSTANGSCTLSPPAKAWLEQTNQQMAAGHCYGFAVASSLLWQSKLAAPDFGGADTPGLRILNNFNLQRRIALDWATQLVDSVRSKIITGTPNDILNLLMKELRPNPTELYTVAIWKQNGAGGHAVTPFAIEDRGGGEFSLLIYDNNWPGQTRAIKVNTNDNTWTYAAAANPDQPSEVYVGNASTKSLALFPTYPGLGTQPCPFCDVRSLGGGVALSDAAAAHAETVGDARVAKAATTQKIFLQGSHVEHPDLLVTDAAGRRLGFVHGRLVQEIPGGRVDFPIANENWATHLAPVLVVPAERRYKITLDSSALSDERTESLGVIGPGFNVSIPDILVRPGDRDTLVLGANGESITYQTAQPRTPTLRIGSIEHPSGAYEFELSGFAQARGSALKVLLPIGDGTFTFSNAGSTQTSLVKLRMTRYTGSQVDVFAHNSIPLIGDAKARVFFRLAPALDDIPISIRRNGRTTRTTLSNEAA